MLVAARGVEGAAAAASVPAALRLLSAVAPDEHARRRRRVARLGIAAMLVVAQTTAATGWPLSGACLGRRGEPPVAA